MSTISAEIAEGVFKCLSVIFLDLLSYYREFYASYSQNQDFIMKRQINAPEKRLFHAVETNHHL